MLEFVDTPLKASITFPTPRQVPATRLDPEVVAPASRPLLAKLDDPTALVVSTGQQPGLFTGPLYTIHKALSAHAIARELERRWKRPVVPVFWNAGDDHDHKEASAAAWLGADGALVSVALEPRPESDPLRPLYAEPVPEALAESLIRFATTSPPGTDRDWTAGWLSRHYQPGASLADAANGALAELLAEIGVVCVEGSAGPLKRAAWPVMRRALVEWESLHRMLDERATELRRTGTDPGVRIGEPATLVMVEGRLGRDRLLPKASGFVTRRSAERFNLEDLDAIATSEPRRLSPNVLLRPVVESAVLPTVAYVAGPAELRYLALAESLYAPLGVPRQIPMPRWSGWVVEPRITRTAEKLGISLAEAVDPAANVDGRLAARLIPEPFQRALADLREALGPGFDRLVSATASIDPTLERPAQSARLGVANTLDQLEKRVTQAVTRRQGQTMDQLGRLRNALAPGGKPQERILGIPGFVARYGRSTVDGLAEHIGRWYAAALEAVAPPT